MRDQRTCRRLPRCKKTGKFVHPDFHSAARHMKRLAKEPNEALDNLGIYECRTCGGWHVGHKMEALQGNT